MHLKAARAFQLGLLERKEGQVEFLCIVVSLSGLQVVWASLKILKINKSVGASLNSIDK